MSKIKGTMKNRHDANAPHISLPSAPRSQEKAGKNMLRDVVFPFILSLGVVVLFVAAVRGGWGLLTRKPKLPGAVLKSTSYQAKMPFSRDLVREHIAFEAYLYVDPASLLTRIQTADPVLALVDTRPAVLYSAEHVKGALNIPITSEPDAMTPAERDKLLQSFKKLEGREIVLYGSSRYSPLVLQSADFLYRNGMAPKILGVGWTEFRRFVNFWLPEEQWNGFDINQYIVTQAKE